MPVNVVILAAGQGKRMHSDLPKVLHRLAGKPLIGHVIAAADALAPSRVCVVYGHGGERVREAVSGTGPVLELAIGTGRVALPKIDNATRLRAARSA